MRYYEITEKRILTEEMIVENLLQNLQKIISKTGEIGKGIIDQTSDQIIGSVNTVKDIATGSAAIVNLVKDKSKFENVVFLIKKWIKTRLKALEQNPIYENIIKYVWKIFPEGRGIKDFFMGLGLICIVNIPTTAINQGIDQTLNNFNLGAAIDSVVSAINPLSQLLNILQWLNLVYRK